MQLKTLSTLCLFSVALIAQAASSPVKSGADASNPGKLLNEMRVNAEQIRSCARNLENLSQTLQEPKWSDYDEQWNMIKPAQERINLETQRLEQMKASLSNPEQQMFGQIKRDVAEITRETNDLWKRLGRQKVDLATPALATDARHLNRAAGDLIKMTASTS